MATATSLDDFDLIGRYTDQPARLPRELCDSVALATGEASICAYALVDLDARLRLAEQWLVLTPGFVVLCQPGEEHLSPNIEEVPNAGTPTLPVSTRPSPTGAAAKPGTELG